MANERQAVMILFNGLTNNGKVYAKGEIERNPTDYLLKVARERTRQFHRDEGKEVRLARIVKNPDADYDDVIDEDLAIRFPIVEETDDLNDMETEELIKVSRSLGLKKDIANSLSSEQLISFSRFMRRL